MLLTPELRRRAAECCILRRELLRAFAFLSEAGRDEDLVRLLELVSLPDGGMPLFYFTTEVVRAVLTVPWRLRRKRPLDYLTFLFCHLAEAGNSGNAYLLDEAAKHFGQDADYSQEQKSELLAEIEFIRLFLKSETALPHYEAFGGGHAELRWRSFASRPHWTWAFGCPHAGYLYLRQPGSYERLCGFVGSHVFAYGDMTAGGVAGSRVLFTAERHLERAEFDTAEPLLHMALMLGERYDAPAVRLAARFCLARFHLAGGRAEKALALVGDQREEVATLGHANYDRCLDLSLCYIRACLGDFAGIPGWLKEKSIAPNLMIVLMSGFIYSLQAKALLLTGDWPHLGALAKSIPASQGANNNLFGHIQALLLEAVAMRHLQGLKKAARILERAIELARPDGLITTMAEYGAHLLPVIRYVAELKPNDGFIAVIHTAVQSYATNLSPATVQNGPLAPQEQAILEKAVLGLPNNDIAQTMGLSPKTVRNTLTRVYAKLGVKNRTQAVIEWRRRTA